MKRLASAEAVGDRDVGRRRDQALAPHRSSALLAAAASLDRMLAAFGRLRDQRAMTSDDVLIFLTIGRLGVSGSSLGVAVHPVTCLDVSKQLKIPAETVRRKTVRLVDAGLLDRTTRGLLVRDIEEWRCCVELLSSISE